MFEQALRIAAGESPKNTGAGSANCGLSSVAWRSAIRMPGAVMRFPLNRSGGPVRPIG